MTSRGPGRGGWKTRCEIEAEGWLGPVPTGESVTLVATGGGRRPRRRGVPGVPGVGRVGSVAMEGDHVGQVVSVGRHRVPEPLLVLHLRDTLHEGPTTHLGSFELYPGLPGPNFIINPKEPRSVSPVDSTRSVPGKSGGGTRIGDGERQSNSGDETESWVRSGRCPIRVSEPNDQGEGITQKGP